MEWKGPRFPNNGCGFSGRKNPTTDRGGKKRPKRKKVGGETVDRGGSKSRPGRWTEGKASSGNKISTRKKKRRGKKRGGVKKRLGRRTSQLSHANIR